MAHRDTRNKLRLFRWALVSVGTGASLLANSLAWSATLKVDQRGLTPGAYVSLAQAVSAVSAGDTIELVAGSGPYREVLDIGTPGTVDSPIVIEGNGELITGFEPFEFTWNPDRERWEYELPTPTGNANPNSPSIFRHLVAYQGQRLLMDRAGTAFTTDHATLSEDGLTLVLGNAVPDEGWEIGTRSSVVRVRGSGPDGTPIAWHHVYRNLRASGSRNDGFNLHGAGTDLRFENIEAFNNFDEGFSAHDSIECTIDGAVFWGNDNGFYNQSRATITVVANNVRAYANLGVGISMRQGTTRLSNSRAWDNGILNLALGGNVESRSNTTYENRWPQAPYLAYQETQGLELGVAYPYAYEPYWQDKPADERHQGYVLSGESPLVLSSTRLLPFALSYQNWRPIYFAPEQILVPVIADESADPDGDGRNNQREYEDGTHPLIVDTPEVRVWIEVPDAEASSETGEPGRILVNRSGDNATPLTVYLATEGSAIADTHYAALPEYVVIPAGADHIELPIVPIATGSSSPGGQWVRIRWRWVWVPNETSTNGPHIAVLRVLPDDAYLIHAPTGTVVIDPKPLPVVTLEVIDGSASEAAGEGGLFRLRRSGAVDQSLSVSYTVDGSATAGVDYASLGSSATFGVGIDYIDLPVDVIADEEIENLETVQLTVQADPAYRLGNAIGLVTIEGLPVSTVSLVASDSNATEAPGNTAAFTVSRPGPGAALTVYFSVDGSATDGVDYLSIGNSVQIPDGETSATILIEPIRDALAESSESVILRLLSDPTYVIGSETTAVASISNYAPPTVSVTVTDSSASERGDNDGSISIWRTGTRTVPLRVAFSLGGSASAGEDYESLSGEVEIPVGSGDVVVPIQPFADSLLEGPETVVLSLLDSEDYVLGDRTTGIITIADVAPPTVWLTVNDGAAGESGDTGLVTIRRTGSNVEPLAVSLMLAGSALPGVDYEDPGATVLIPAGASSITLTLVPLADLLIEDSETIELSLVAQSHYLLGDVTMGSVSIADAEPVQLSLSVGDSTASESGSDTAHVLVTRRGPTTEPIVVQFELGGGAVEGLDYETIARPVTIPAGEESISLVVQPIDDTSIEGVETVVISLTASPSYLIGPNATSVLTIFDDTPVSLTLSAAVANASELPGNPGSFLISADRVLAQSLQIPIELSGSATHGSDYASLPGTVEMPVGQSTLLVLVEPRMDSEAEDTETVTMTFGESQDYVTGSSASATIFISNVVPPELNLKAMDSSATESPGNGGVFMVTRTGSKTEAVTVNFAVSGSATPGVDYLDPGSQLEIPAGEHSATLAITPLPDALVEPTETVVLSLVADSSYALGSTITGTVNIVDVPLPTVTLSVVDATAGEAPGDFGSFRVTRSGSRTVAMNVSVSLSGSAVEGADYTAIGTEVVIPAGAGNVIVPVLPLPDLWVEDTETVTLHVLEQPHYQLGAVSEGSVGITDLPLLP